MARTTPLFISNKIKYIDWNILFWVDYDKSAFDCLIFSCWWWHYITIQVQIRICWNERKFASISQKKNIPQFPLIGTLNDTYRLCELLWEIVYGNNNNPANWYKHIWHKTAKSIRTIGNVHHIQFRGWKQHFLTCDVIIVSLWLGDGAASSMRCRHLIISWQ